MMLSLNQNQSLNQNLNLKKSLNLLLLRHRPRQQQLVLSVAMLVYVEEIIATQSGRGVLRQQINVRDVVAPCAQACPCSRKHMQQGGQNSCTGKVSLGTC